MEEDLITDQAGHGESMGHKEGRKRNGDAFEKPEAADMVRVSGYELQLAACHLPQAGASI